MKKIVFTFGRMNPPTIGHQKLVDKVNAVAKSNSADARVYLSHTQNNKKDPLDYTTKYRIAKKAFGPTVYQSGSKTIIQILQELEKDGYTDVVMVAGSDRVPEFKSLLTKYNGNAYNFESIDIVSAGERDPDAEGVEGMSASKLRALALQGDYDTFKSGLPKRLSDADAKKIYNTIRSVIKEEFELEEDRKPLTIQQRFQRARLLKRLAPKLARMRKIKAKRVADARTIQKRALKVARSIIRKKVAGQRGAEYKELSPTEKITIDKLVAKKGAVIQKMAKRLLPKVRKAEIERAKRARAPKEESFDINTLFEARVAQDPTIKDREGTQPKKYFSGLSPSTKEKRDAAFQKGKKASDDSPSSYKPAPGDAEAKTKPSKYTKKYKQMFGEQDAVARAKDQIKREKQSDKEKHDRLLDRARIQDTQAKNRQTEEYELSEDATAALQKKADKSGIPLGILRQVYNRGMAAWKTGHRPGATQQQWGFARVNSFITGGKTRTTADADLWAKAKGRKEEVQEDSGSVQHHQFQKTLKHAMDHAKMHQDLDLDGDVDVLDKMVKKVSPESPDEVTGTEKNTKKIQDFWQKKRGELEKKHTRKGVAFESVELDEARAKQAVAGGKVQKFITGFDMTYKGKKYDEIDFELVKIDNASQVVTLKILHPKEHIGDEVKIPFKTLRRGSFMATDTSKINEACWDGYRQAGMKKKGDKMVPNCVPEAVSPAQQAAIAISKKKNLKSMLAVPSAYPKDEIDEDWFSNAIGKVVHKRGYQKAKEILQMVIDRKKKEGGLKHDIPYYAQQIARQFQGVDARELTKMVESKDITESFQVAKGAGTGHTMYATEFMKIQGAFEHHPDVIAQMEEGGAGEFGTDKLTKKYKKDTPMESCCDDCEDYFDHIVEESEYQGKKVKLNDPFRTPQGPKKFSVYVKNEKGNVVKVNFGDPNMEIKRDDPNRRASFRARHGCDNPGPKWKARYWSCYQWRSGSKVDN